jgi:non-ribosomal peptide synthetase component F
MDFTAKPEARFRKLLVELQSLLELNDANLPQRLYEKRQETPPDKLVHSLIEYQAKKTPETVAVQFEHTSSVTYRELNELSNAVARQLVCGRGAIIPICMERSINMIIALLAVMKAGAAYVLISPESPIERNRFIVEDTKAPFVLVSTSTQTGLKGTREIIVDNLLVDASYKNDDYSQNLNAYQSSSEIAYVIYTSGTTGHPKGVLLSHLAASTGLNALPRLEESERLKQLLCHSPVFSAAQRTILGTLTRGGTLYLASKEKITAGLADTIRKLQIESLEITPSMLQLINLAEFPKSVKRITLGGELAGPAIIEAWAGKVELWNAYGLSECTQVCFRGNSIILSSILIWSSSSICDPVSCPASAIQHLGSLRTVGAPDSPA